MQEGLDEWDHSILLFPQKNLQSKTVNTHRLSYLDSCSEGHAFSVELNMAGGFMAPDGNPFAACSLERGFPLSPVSVYFIRALVAQQTDKKNTWQKQIASCA